MSVDIPYELDQMLNYELESVTVPVIELNKIRIKDFSISSKEGQYAVINELTNQIVTTTFFKISALAIAKRLAAGKGISQNFISYDTELEKLNNDAVYYRYMLSQNISFDKREILLTRLELTTAKLTHIKNKLLTVFS